MMSHRVSPDYHMRRYSFEIDPLLVKDYDLYANSLLVFKFTSLKYIDGLKHRSFCFSQLSKFHPEENNLDLVDSKGVYDEMEGGIISDNAVVEVLPSSENAHDASFASNLQKALSHASDVEIEFHSPVVDRFFKGDSFRNLTYSEWGKEIQYRKILSLSIPDFELEYISGSSVYFKLNQEYLKNFRESFPYECVAVFSMWDIHNYVSDLAESFDIGYTPVYYYDPVDTSGARKHASKYGYGFQKRRFADGVDYSSQRELRIAINNYNNNEDRSILPRSNQFAHFWSFPVNQLDKALFHFNEWNTNGKHELRFVNIVKDENKS